MVYLVDSYEISEEEGYYLRKLQHLVNIIPIVSKGDHITEQEIPLVKEKLNSEAMKLGVEWFNCKDVFFSILTI